jgi:hypothetical protein
MTRILGALLLSAAIIGPQAAYANTIDWASWSDIVASPTSGSATGTTASGNFTYTGELQSFQANYPSYTPVTTFSGGTVDNAPPQANGIIQLFGGTGAVDTITFASAVTNPVIAIWSLGQGGLPASFQFSIDPSLLSIAAGGPSAEYGGTSITLLGNDVSGVEGNGVVQFTGTFDSISWTNPTSENWYGFTVGVSEVPGPTLGAGPASFVLAALFLGWLARRRASQFA